MQRDQFNKQQIPVSDLTMALEQHKHRIANLLYHSCLMRLIGSKDLSTTRCRNDCRDMKAYPHRSLNAESLSDCDDTHERAQDQDVELSEPPHVPVELSIIIVSTSPSLSQFKINRISRRIIGSPRLPNK